MHFKMLKLFAGIICLVSVSTAHAADFDLAASATNQLGVDLHRQLARGDENLCLSPYSIQSALAMTFAGADGDTRTEMARVLHFPNDGDSIHASFAALQDSLDEMAKKIDKESKREGSSIEPIILTVANRLFGQTGYDFHDPFQQLVKKFYGAPLEPVDFKKELEPSREHINQWIAEHTRNRIRDLIPINGVTTDTRLVLANALYLKAQWLWQFDHEVTKPGPFHVRGRDEVDVPIMHKREKFGYDKRDGFTALTVPYIGSDLQFLVLLPAEALGLSALESKLDAKLLADCAKLKERDVDLSLPKFKLEPATISLGGTLQTLGMKTVFDQPKGSANLEKIATRKPDEYLAISEVFHKTFIAVDEIGTEAAAATTDLVLGVRLARSEPIHVKVDRPFIYAIQHVPSGACLFIGRVTDPR
jgi:serpin B